ncbi:tetratricopeptide repeat protein [bacterium]|nr:tetratricopeptide repeat protein [bacterium]
MNRAARILVLLLGAILLAVSSPAEELTVDIAQNRFDEANELYQQGQYQEAFEAYRTLYRDGIENPQVLANAGNAAYRAGDVGQAVVFYKRALRLAPGYSMPRQNLQLVEPSTNVLEGASMTSLVSQWFSGTYRMFWIVLAELTFLAFLITLFAFGRSEPHTDTRAAWGSRVAWVALLLIATSGLLTLHISAGDSGGDAVVIEDKSITRSGPGEKFFQQLELPSGTVLDLVRSPERGWVQFKLLDGRSGYIRTDAIERI